MARLPVTLRRATPDDAPAFSRVMGDPAVLANLMQVPYPAESRWRAILAGYDEPGRLDLALVAEAEGRIVGSAGLHPASPQIRRRHCVVLGISVLPEAQGRGVGHALMQALCDYADRWGQILRIELTVFADNARAIALYRRFGFVQEGVHRGYALRDGAYADVISMARLHPSPPVIAPFEAPAA